MLLGLFLFANYGINFTDFHHHEHHSSNEGEKSQHSHLDCYVCDFQGLFYEPLTQKIFLNLQNTDLEYIPIGAYFVSHIISDYYNAIQQRGPPVLGA